MSKKKGLSLEEKRTKMLELLYEKKEFFQMKELEKMAPKEKGIVSQSVKEVVQMLVDDGLVDVEKVGTIMCYWAFPSKALQIRKNKLSSLQQEIAEMNAKVNLLRINLEEAKLGKEEGPEREKLVEDMKNLECRRASIQKELIRLKDCDPEVVEKLKAETKMAKEATNRWTDNIFSVKQWCRNKFGMEEAMLNKQFGIPEELDYVD